MAASPLFNRPSDNTQGIFDISALCPRFDLVYMLGVSGAVSASGYFVDVYGNRLGNSFTGSIPQGGGTPQTFAALAGGTLPAGAAGVRVVLGGNIYWDVTLQGTADFTANYKNYPIAIADPEFNIFGRVG